MSVPVNIPEIVILRNRVEEAFGKPLETHNAFISPCRCHRIRSKGTSFREHFGAYVGLFYQRNQCHLLKNSQRSFTLCWFFVLEGISCRYQEDFSS